MQVKSLTLAFPPTLDISWSKRILQRAFALAENVYHRIFGCWHTDMSRPFTVNQETYRMCLKCGAHRAFDIERWQMVGPYYLSRPEIQHYRPVLTVVHSQMTLNRKLRRTA